MLLADRGAEEIKIESSESGINGRWALHRDDAAARKRAGYLICRNRCSRSNVRDMRSEMIWADIRGLGRSGRKIVENFSMVISEHGGLGHVTRGKSGTPPVHATMQGIGDPRGGRKPVPADCSAAK